MKKVLLAVAAFALLWTGCQKKTKGSPIPHIDFMFFTDSVHAGYFKDTAFLDFKFTDGDADLGGDGTSSQDIFLIDSRDSMHRTIPFPFPEITDALKNPDYGMDGVAQLNLLAATPILYPRDTMHMRTGDTVVFEFYIKDNAGHESNHQFTTPLYIRPQ